MIRGFTGECVNISVCVWGVYHVSERTGELPHTKESVRVKTSETPGTHTETETAGNMRFCVLTCTVSPETSIFMQK